MRSTVRNTGYWIAVYVGDLGHEQFKQKVLVEGIVLIGCGTTAPGQFVEAFIDVTMTDGRLAVDLGSGEPNSNTYINWLRIVTRR